MLTTLGMCTGGLKMQDQKMEGQKKDERTENAGLKMEDQMSWVENAGPENAFSSPAFSGPAFSTPAIWSSGPAFFGPAFSAFPYLYVCVCARKSMSR